MPVQTTPSRPILVQEAMQPATLTIGAGASLPAAVLLMETLGVRRLLVLQEGRLAGLLTDGAVRRALPKLTDATAPWDYIFQAARLQVSEIMRQDLYTASPGDTLDQTIHRLLEKRVGGLPVVDAHGLLEGLLTVTDVLRTALAKPQPGWGTVGEHMSTEVIVVPPEAPLTEAAALLKVTRLRVLPVAQEGLLLGVLHEQDIGAMVARQVATPASTVLGDRLSPKGTCRDLMKSPSAEVLVDASLAEAMQVMLSADVHGVPVVDAARGLLGVLTLSDVLRALLIPQPSRARGSLAGD